MAVNAKFSGTDNRLWIEDRSGLASVPGKADPDMLTNYSHLSSEVEVPVLDDLKRATFAVVAIKNYNGFPVDYRRELAFIKNRFLVSREIVRFREGFLTQLAAVYNSQNVGPQIGSHWANTYFDELRGASFPQPLRNPTYDLLVWFAPRPDCRLRVVDRTATDPRAQDVPAQVQYHWRGLARAGQRLSFTQVLYPHAASLKHVTSNVPGAVRPQDLVGTAGADGIHVVTDTVETTVLRCTLEEERTEWIVFNPDGGRVEAGALATDARFAYVDVQKAKIAGVSASHARFLTVDGENVFRRDEPSAFER